MAEKPVIERYLCLELYLADEYDKDVYLAADVDPLLDRLRDALRTIQRAGNNSDATAIWMQKIAAHALHPEQWPHPRGGTKP